MFFKYSDGNCPQCEVRGKIVPMRLNTDGHWECPQCGLQASGTAWVKILRERGTGDFLSEEILATKSIAGSILTAHDGRRFRSREDLGKYTETEIS